jgi:phospholipase C
MSISRRKFLRIAGSTAAVVGATACGGGSTGDNNNGGPDPGGGGGGGNGNGDASLSGRIDHIIFTMQENRSFDHYFGHLNAFRSAKGVSGTVDGTPADARNPSRDDPNVFVTPFHQSTEQHENLSPAWNESHRQYNRNNPASPTATLDGFVYTAAGFSRNEAAAGRFACDLDGTRAMGFYDERDIPFYYDLATKFATSDRMFASVSASTEPNRLYLIGASSFGYIRPLGQTEIAKGDPVNGTRVDAPTIFDRLEEKGISWKIYLEQSGSNPFSYYQLFRSYDQHKEKVRPADEFFSDVSSGNLPQVVMIESGVDTGLDEHPNNHIQRGAAYIRRRVDALMKSAVWGKSAFFLTYDEGGGFYDHVAPATFTAPDNIGPFLRATDTPGDFTRGGYRVPFIAVSPWIRPGFISHTNADHTSILRFIERRFELSALTNRDGNAHDLLDMFDFSSAAYEQPPNIADQPTNGSAAMCNYI